MAQTKLEKQVNEIYSKLVLFMERQESLLDTHEKLKIDVAALKKTVYENGLNSKVTELHRDMMERREQDEERQRSETARKAEIIKSNLQLRNLVLAAIVTSILSIIAGFVR